MVGDVNTVYEQEDVMTMAEMYQPLFTRRSSSRTSRRLSGDRKPTFDETIITLQEFRNHYSRTEEPIGQSMNGFLIVDDWMIR